jgi:hypothetical protein
MCDNLTAIIAPKWAKWAQFTDGLMYYSLGSGPITVARANVHLDSRYYSGMVM